MSDDLILVIEDDRDLNSILCDTLRLSGYEARSAYDGANGLRMAMDEEYALVLLDLMLPGRSGEDLLRALREKSSVPVIIISAKDHPMDKVELLRAGADDYMTKPFNFDEVIGRIGAVLRRTRATARQSSRLRYQGLEYNRDTAVFTLCGKELDLTKTESQLLELFLSNPNKIFKKDTIASTIWNSAYIGDDVLSAHIKRLRKKLTEADPKGEYIHTIWGIGYRLSDGK